MFWPLVHCIVSGDNKIFVCLLFVHTTIQVNDPEASLSNMSNTINKKPCKNTTQAGTNHKILLNSFFWYKNPIICSFILPKIHFHCHFIFQLIQYWNMTKNLYTSIVQYSYIFLYEYVNNTRIRVLLSSSSNDPQC